MLQTQSATTSTTRASKVPQSKTASKVQSKAAPSNDNGTKKKKKPVSLTRAANRRTIATKSVKVLKKGKHLLIGDDITLEIVSTIDVGREGAVYLIRKISPSQHKAMLQRVPKGQRGIKPEHVRAIQGDMKIGKFVWTGEPIRFNGQGMYIDGQHRSEAAARSGTTLYNQLLVVVLKKANMASIDEGAKRNIRDHRAIQGKKAFEYAVIAAVTYEVSNWSTHSSRGLSNGRKDELIDDITYLDKIETIHHKAKSTYGNLDCALAAVAIHCMRKPKDRKDAVKFFTAIAENTHTVEGSRSESKQIKAACNHLHTMGRDYREGRGEGDTRKRRSQTTFRLMTAWNAWRTKKQLPSPWRYNPKTDTIPAIV